MCMIKIIMNLTTTKNSLSFRDINYCDIESKIIKIIEKFQIGETEDFIKNCKLLIDIFKIFESYLNVNLKQNDGEYKIILQDREYDYFDLTVRSKSIEHLLYILHKKFFIHEFFINRIFSICLEKENTTLEKYINLPRKYKNKLEKNGILYHKKLLHIENVEQINIEKFKKKLNLIKYCKEKFQYNIINTFKSNDIFIYFK